MILKFILVKNFIYCAIFDVHILNCISLSYFSDSKSIEIPCQYKPSPELFKNDSSETVLIEDILVEPKRSSRPKQLVIILRGLPGSGKTYFAKLIKVSVLLQLSLAL